MVLFYKLKLFWGGPLIVVGDLNCVMWEGERGAGGGGGIDVSGEDLKSAVLSFELQDVDKDGGFTYFGKNITSQINFCFSPKVLKSKSYSFQ